MRHVFMRAALFGGVLLGPYVPETLGQLNITVNVTPIGSNYHYEYALTNEGAADILIISIAVPPDPAAITNLVAPPGFLASFDPGLGLLDFLEHTEAFASQVTVEGFAFDSPAAPGAAHYTALDIHGTQITGTTLAPVPEPGTGLMLCGVWAVIPRRRRRGR